MDTGRDLACPALWQESLERSLARRGQSTRASLELFHLRPERDLSRPELLHESLMYSQLRRSAVARRPALGVPSAGGISALALLAAATLPGLVGGRRGGSERVAFAGATGRARLEEGPARRASLHPSVPATAMAHPTSVPPVATGMLATPAAVAASTHAGPAASRPTVRPVHAKTASTSSSHSVAPSHHATAPRYTAAAHEAVARKAKGGVAHALSAAAAPAARKHSVAPRVPAGPQPSGHPSTGGGVIEGGPNKAMSVPRPTSTPAAAGGVTTSPDHRAPRRAHAPATRHPVSSRRPAATHPVRGTHSTPAHPVSGTHPTPAHPVTGTHPTAAHPVTATHLTATHPVTANRPTATTHPPPRAPVPAPAPAPSGRYVNPLAGASVTPERIDQGVDYSGSGTLGAIGDGKVTYVGTSGTGWPGAFVEYQLTGGSDAGRYVYYAESISPAAGLHVGQAVRAGQPIASISGGIEVGWGSGLGTQPLAQADGQWSSGGDGSNYASADGKDFSALIARLGGPPGKVEG